MEDIQRDIFLNKLIESMGNGLIKVITGVRRCGKSYLLDPMFVKYLKNNKGVDDKHIIKVDFEERRNKDLLNPDELDEYIRKQIVDEKIYYILLDEIQKVEDFESVLNGFLKIRNTDIYVTGSNSKFLSSDIITEFRGRGYEIRITPLTFAEFFSSRGLPKEEAFSEYLTFGGLPYILKMNTIETKSNYLKNLYAETYLKDIIERNKIQKTEALESILNILSSSVGSLTNANKIANAFNSNGVHDISYKTVSTYINYLMDAFLISKAERYDIKGKQYIETTAKYFYVDPGLRNARLNFREQAEDHLMENIIYNELVNRGYNVDVGIVEYNSINKNGNSIRKQLEVDFVCNQGSKRYYIQSAYAMPTKEKMEQEQASLIRIDDSFKKIIIVNSNVIPYYNEKGIKIMNVKDFLLDINSLEK